MEIKYYRKMKLIERLSGTFKHRSYNLLEHSYMVAVLFKHFASKENVAYDINVLDIILHHDIVEVETMDLIYTVKNNSEVTKDCWEKIENDILKKHKSIERYSDPNIKRNLTLLQHSLFKACDILDLWIFLKEEVSIGNKSKNVLEIIKRCEEIITKDFRSINTYMAEYD